MNIPSKLAVQRFWISIYPEVTNSTLERRVFFLIVSMSLALTFLGNVSNITLGMPLPLILITAAAFLLSLIFLIFMRKWTDLSGPTYLLFFSTHFFIIASWFFNGGVDGPNIQIIILYSIAIYIIVPPKMKFTVFLSYLILSTLLIICSFKYPGYILNYASKEERFVDLIVANFFFTISFYYMIVLVLRNYEYEQKKVEKHNINLNLLNLELSRKNEIIKSYSGKLQEANATKDRFFSIIAHDLRAPFSPILGLSELLKNQINDLNKTEIMEISSKLNSVSRSGFNLLENLLEWASLQTDSIEFVFEKIDPNELILEIMAIYHPIADAKEITLEKDIHESSSIYVDENTIKTVLRNVISNAIKFTPRGGNIKLSTKIDKEFCVITIKDSGIGLSPDDILKLFRIDLKLLSKGTEGEMGTGLGLILSHDYVGKNGGTLNVESELGKGTSFSISLPLIPMIQLSSQPLPGSHTL